MLIEGLLGEYDSVVEWNEQMDFFLFFSIKKYNFRRVATISESAVKGWDPFTEN